jgi:hypothetical protein
LFRVSRFPSCCLRTSTFRNTGLYSHRKIDMSGFEKEGKVTVVHATPCDPLGKVDV